MLKGKGQDNFSREWMSEQCVCLVFWKRPHSLYCQQLTRRPACFKTDSSVPAQGTANCILGRSPERCLEIFLGPQALNEETSSDLLGVQVA